MNLIFTKIFRFLASLQLAVINISALAILLSIATFYESSTSTEQAQQYIYSTRWFDFLLFLFGVNVTCAALSRYPWKKRHTGFVITHIGIIIILIGSLITRKFGIEGQMVLQEGQSTDHISIANDIVLSVALPDQNIQTEYDPWFVDSSIPKGQEVAYDIAGTNLTCYVEGYYFNPRVSESITNDNPTSNPAIMISVFAPNAPNPFQDWLFANVPGRSSFDLNIAHVHFHGVLSDREIAEKFNPLKSTEEKPQEQGTIELKDADGKVVRMITIDELQKGTISFEHNNENYEVALIDYFEQAAVVDNQLVNKPNGSWNPAVKFSIQNSKGKEEHLAFALFPEFGSLHGDQKSYSGFSVAFSAPEKKSEITNQGQQANDEGNSVDLFLTQDGQWRYRAQNTQGKITMGETGVGETLDTTWNGVMMKVDQYYPNAKIHQIVTDAGRNAPPPHNNPVVKVRVENNGDSMSDYVIFNSPKVMRVGGDTCVVEFGQRKVDVGFSVTLVDFRAPRYPGTNRPERFESDVILTDEGQGIKRKQKVYMNHPLIHNNFKVYQASYIEGTGGRPDTSIFSVARAPGTPVIYAGSIIMILGMIFLYKDRNLFFTKKSEFDW